MARSLVLAATWLLAGCAATAGARQVLPPSQVAARTQQRPANAASHLRGWLAPNADRKDPWLYVAGSRSDDVLIYDLAKLGVPQIGAITTGISTPQGVSIDAAGTLYVANATGTVTLYPAGAVAPSLTLSQGLSNPIYAVPDAEGNVWVTNRGTIPDIVIYPPGQTTPAQTITANLIQVPAEIAFDSSGDAFFSDNLTGVSEIPAGSTQPVSLHLKNFPNQTNGLAIEPHEGTIFVSFGFSTNQVNVYPRGHERPSRVLSAPTADFLALGKLHGHLDLFVPGSLADSITVFHRKASAPFASFPVGTKYTEGAAIKPADVP